MKNIILSICFLIPVIVYSKTNHKLLSPNPISQPTDKIEGSFNIYYQTNALIVKGPKVNGNLKIYSIIGNKILDLNIQDFSDLRLSVDLIKQNMYIIRVETSDSKVFTHKIVAR